jgi:orotidine-5'-phosphate decarboxylase
MKMDTIQDKVIIVLDVDSREKALHLVRSLKDQAGMFKVGSQLYMAGGPALVQEIIEMGAKVFLDLKFHDIPNTVKHAVLEAAKLGVSMMTVHASGGRAMLETAAKELRDKFGSRKPMIVGVTVLTSLDSAGLREVGVQRALDEQVVELARLAENCSLDGVVCSPREIQLIRKAVQRGFKIVTPGIRMPGQSANDQQRTATPSDTIAAGADYIVVGRAVTDDPEPQAALERLIQSL